MTIVNFTPWSALVGGVIIGLAAAFTLYALGRSAGISGILEGVIRPKPREFGWRAAFVIGLLLTGTVMAVFMPQAFVVSVHRSTGALVVAGLLVGFGTRLGGGCTSGHGVCGIGRLSTRSIVATLVFMAVGMAAVAVVSRTLAGAI